MQEVHLDKDVKLLDCLGVVMLKFGENDASIALKNCKRIEKLEDPVGPGKIPYYTMPPSRNNGEVMEASIVSELGKEFNVNEVYDNETSFISSLMSTEDFQTAAEAPPIGRIYFDEAIMVETKPSVLAEQKLDNSGDQPMGVEDEEAGKNKPKAEGIKQNEKLYAVEGMLNTRLHKADKKRRKKANKAMLETDEMDVVTKNSDDGNEMRTEAPTAGIEFDN